MSNFVTAGTTGMLPFGAFFCNNDNTDGYIFESRGMEKYSFGKVKPPGRAGNKGKNRPLDHPPMGALTMPLVFPSHSHRLCSTQLQSG